jgi:hypothetical protein
LVAHQTHSAAPWGTTPSSAWASAGVRLDLEPDALKADELKATGKTMAQTEMASWASAAFTSADTDKSTTVTKAELGKFLGG